MRNPLNRTMLRRLTVPKDSLIVLMQRWMHKLLLHGHTNATTTTTHTQAWFMKERHAHGHHGCCGGLFARLDAGRQEERKKHAKGRFTAAQTDRHIKMNRPGRHSPFFSCWSGRGSAVDYCWSAMNAVHHNRKKERMNRRPHLARVHRTTDSIFCFVLLLLLPPRVIAVDIPPRRRSE